MMKKIIYGAGDFGKRLFLFLFSNGISVDYFCQSQNTSQSYLFNVPIISLEQLISIENEKVILIAINNEETSSQIRLSLLRLRNNIEAIYECGGFIRKNLRPNLNLQNKYCISCNSFVDGFMPGGISEKIFDEHHIIGGGYRENVVCPICHCNDRERWEMYVLEKYTKIFFSKCSVLHFAPEYHVAQRIKNNEKCDYYSGDIEYGKAMHIVDVTNIQFKDVFFDYIIINHVLEHIEDEQRAMMELRRVLKVTGKLIMSFPVCMDQKTIEDRNICSEEERLKMYGQKDHVRLYGYEYKELIEKYGLLVNVYSPRNECSEADIDRFGFIPDDIIMICEKKIGSDE